MTHISLRAYGRLNDFLPVRRRQRRFEHDVNGYPSVKDVIESLGIPHPEIELVLVNDLPADFSHRVQVGDRISIYPPFRQIELSTHRRIPRDDSDKPRFVLDTHLGRLARYLRMLGFDTRYRNDFGDPELSRICREEDRVLLTQDVGLMKRSEVEHGYFVRNVDPRRQLVEVTAEFDLLDRATPFQRCLRCNGELFSVDKSEIADRLPPRTRAEFDEFFRCAECGTIYWKGSHYDHMLQIIDDLQHELHTNGYARRGDSAR